MSKAKQSDNIPTVDEMNIPDANSLLVHEQLTELRAAISQMKEDISGLANLVGEHQTRLFHLGDTTKPIPSKIFQELSLSEIFSGVVSSVVVGYIQQYPNSVKSDESILSYVNEGIRVGTMMLSELIKRSEEAHRQ